MHHNAFSIHYNQPFQWNKVGEWNDFENKNICAVNSI